MTADAGQTIPTDPPETDCDLGAVFRAASGTVLGFFAELGGAPAVTAVLHTWGQALGVHPHVHMLITGGALSFGRNRWIGAGPTVPSTSMPWL